MPLGISYVLLGLTEMFCNHHRVHVILVSQPGLATKPLCVLALLKIGTIEMRFGVMAAGMRCLLL